MTKLFTSLLLITLLIPNFSFSQENPTYEITGAGMFFMIFAWSAIIIWNTVCFTKILSKKDK
ncbi:MAG: hypothetical protein ACRCWI_01025 [Brevinema sp.]